MALPVAVYEVRSSATAGNLNGGGFNSARGGQDYTLQDAAQVTNTDGTAAGTTNFASLGTTFTSNMVGNFLHITASTGLTVGWYEITAFVDVNNVTLDRTPGTGTITTFYVGGAMSMASTLDSEFLNIFIAGSTVWVKLGTYTIGEAIAVTNDATSSLPVNINGYQTTRGDNPTEANRPTWDYGANASSFSGNYYNLRNFIMTTTSPAGLEPGIGNLIENVKITNSSGSANREAIDIGSADVGIKLINCEFISTNGNAIQAASPARIIGCYIHDSNVGITSDADGVFMAFNIIDTCVTGLSMASGTDRWVVLNNTFYGAETPAGTGITQLTTVGVENTFFGNIIYGFVTGVTATSAVESNLWDYNDFFNNTTARTNITAGAHDVAIDPLFANAANGNFMITGAI